MECFRVSGDQRGLVERAVVGSIAIASSMAVVTLWRWLTYVWLRWLLARVRLGTGFLRERRSPTKLAYLRHSVLTWTYPRHMFFNRPNQFFAPRVSGVRLLATSDSRGLILIPVGCRMSDGRTWEVSTGTERWT